MKSTRLRGLLGTAIGCCLIVIGVARPASADTVYRYSGNTFDVFSGTDSCSAGVGECSIQGWFTLASPLAANLGDTAITPESFSFTNGSVTITDANEGGDLTFDFSTNSTGTVTGWSIVMYDSLAPPIFGATYTGLSSQNQPTNVQDKTFIGIDFVDGNPGQASINNDPGVWTVTSTPEPPAVLLLGTGLLILTGIGVRKRLIA